MKTIGILGLGAIGRLIADDLFKTFDGEIILLGRDLKRLKQLAKRKKNVKIRYANVSDTKLLASAFRGIDVVIHAVHHEFNLNVMKACLKSKSHYVDLGGLFHYTKKQLKLNYQFKKANLTAVLGIGAAPGITNVLAKYGSSFLDKVENVEIKIGGKDQSTYKQTSPLSNTYSLQTIFEEFSWKPAIFTEGKLKFLEPISGREDYIFPGPVGVQKPQYTIHSEIATLPSSLHAKNVSFKIAFDDDFVNKIKMLKELGFLSEEKIKLKEKEFVIKFVSLGILKKLPNAIPDRINQYEIISVIVTGKKSGARKKIVLEAYVHGINETDDKDTAAPASIAAQMVANGMINKRGVFPPELIVPSKSFFNELAKRKIYIYLNKRHRQ